MFDSSAPLRVHLEPARDGAYHMRRDTELLHAQDIEAGPTLRLYTWSPPAVSIGYLQHADEVLDLEACRHAGFDVVRRPTGGRAVLHWEEITYAIVATTQDTRFGTHLAETHARIGACLAAGLAHLGVAVELARPTRDRARRLLRHPCFSSAGRAELLVDGRKLAGSAQRRTSHAFLQHGSLLVGPAHEQLVDLLRDVRTDLAGATQMRARLHQDTVTLRELLGFDPSFEVLAEALARGFRQHLGLEAHHERARAGSRPQ